MPKASKFSPDEGITIYDLKDSEAVHWADNSIIGVKNWMPPFNNFVITGNIGITMTDNGDGTVTVNTGTVSTAGGYWLYKGGIKLKDLGIDSLTDYKMVAELSNNSNTGYVTFTFKNTTRNINHIVRLFFNGDPTYYENEIIHSSELNDNFDIYFWCQNGSVISNPVIIKPMLKLSSDTDNTFCRYAKTNQVLTKNQFPRSEQIILGAKNLLKYPYQYTSRTDNGITFTVNNYGQVILNGTSTDRAEIQLLNRIPSGIAYKYFPLGDYIYSLGIDLTGTGIGGQLGTTKNNAYNHITGYEAGFEKQFNLNASQSDILVDNEIILGVYIYVLKGYTFNDLVLSPMIRINTDSDRTFTTYAMTNRELTTKAQGIIDAATNAADFAAFKTAIGNL